MDKELSRVVMRTCGCMYTRRIQIFFSGRNFSSQASALIHIYTQRNGKDGRGSKELPRRSIAYFESPRISNYLSLKCDQIVGK